MEQEILEEGLDLELLKIEKELAKIPANLTGYINTNLVTIKNKDGVPELFIDHNILQYKNLLEFMPVQEKTKEKKHKI